MIKKILIAIDDQAPDTCLIDQGIAIADQLGAEIGLVDVAKLSIGYIEAGIYPADFEEIDKKRAETTVKSIKEMYSDIDFVDFEKVGDAVEEIKSIIENWKPDMLVVGHHKTSVFLRLSDNSRERRFINQLNIPVLVFPCD